MSTEFGLFAEEVEAFDFGDGEGAVVKLFWTKNYSLRCVLEQLRFFGFQD